MKKLVWFFLILCWCSVLVSNVQAEENPSQIIFDSDRNVGLPPLNVNFTSQLSSADVHSWSFGDIAKSGDNNPQRTFWLHSPSWDPGAYDVTLNDATISQFVHVYEPKDCLYTPLSFVDGSPAAKGEGWDNAVDGDTWLENGTATVTADENGVWAIFQFSNEVTKKIKKIRMMNDTGLGEETGCVSDFKVYVSTTGTEDADFELLLDAKKENNKNTPFIFNDDWQEWAVESVDAKYIKLVIETPEQHWRRLGEFEIYEDTLLSTDVETFYKYFWGMWNLFVEYENGMPVSGWTADDIQFYAVDDDKQIIAGPDELAFGEIFPGGYVLFSDYPEIFCVARGVLYGTYKWQPGLRDDESNFLFSFRGTPCSKGEDWTNAVDGDLDGWDGTVTTKGTEDSPGVASCYFGFSDRQGYSFNSIGIKTDNGAEDDNYPERQATCIRVLAATYADYYDDNFHEILTIYPTDGEFHWYDLPAEEYADYLKLEILGPAEGWKQLVEFKVGQNRKDLAEAASDEIELSKVVDTFQLQQNYPNPFNPVTRISYTLPKESYIELSIYDIRGQRVGTLVNQVQQAGAYSEVWDATDFASGVYFYNLKADDFSITKRMLLVR